MIAVTINGENCWLLTAAPNTARDLTLGVSLDVDLQRRLTGRTSRRPLARTLLFSQSWTAQLRPEEFTAVRNVTQLAQNEPVVVPLWLGAYRIGVDAAPLAGGLTLAWTPNFASYAINPVSLSGYTFAAPLLMGFFSSVPAITSRNGDFVLAEFSFVEDSPASYAVAPAGGLLADDALFALASGDTAPVFPFVPEWSSAPKPGLGAAEAERERVGPGRQRAQVFYPQPRELLQEAGFKFKTASAAAQLIEWWRRRAGIAEAHWVAGVQRLGQLAADVAVDDDALTFAAPMQPLGSNAYIALFAPRAAPEFARVTSSTSTSLALAAGVAAAWPKDFTVVAPAMLARHTTRDLQLSCRRTPDGWMATATLGWREVAAEYTVPAGEERGVTLGRLKPPAFFFQLDLDYNGALRSWYLTNWESGAYANLQDWTYNACAFDKLRASIDLEDDGCTFRFRYFEGGPWDNWLPGQLAARGFITIYRAEVEDDGSFANFRQVWKGELKVPSFDGPLVSWKAIGANALFARTAPRQVMSPICGTMLFRPRCGLALADWQFSAAISGVSGNIVTVDTIARVNTDPAPAGFGAADWFALGWMEWIVDGAPYRDGVLTSGALSGGTIELTLERACGLGVGSSVVLVPGCDRRGATCRDKFGNYDNFRGFENIPAVSPSFVLPQRKFTSAKK